ncbi:MAG: hypothetical protein KIT27_02415 [Legionellales bacterium]|nr:hypothetical protein [Legionellales bacterium]
MEIETLKKLLRAGGGHVKKVYFNNFTLQLKNTDDPFSRNTSTIKINTLETSFNSIEEIHFQNCSDSIGIYKTLFIDLPNLKAIYHNSEKLIIDTSFSDQQIAMLLANANNLTHLEIHNAKSLCNFLNLYPTSLQDLNSLKIRGDFSSLEIVTIIEKMPSLHELGADNSKLMMKIIEENPDIFNNREHIHLSSGLLSADKIYSLLESSVGSTVLNIKLPEDIDLIKFTSLIANIKSLRQLQLSGKQLSIDYILTIIRSLPNLNKLTHDSKAIDLINLEISQDELRIVVEGAYCLEEIFFNNPHQLYDDDAENILFDLGKTEVRSINFGNYELTAKQFSKLLFSAKNLQEVYFKYQSINLSELCDYSDKHRELIKNILPNFNEIIITNEDSIDLFNELIDHSKFLGNLKRLTVRNGTLESILAMLTLAENLEYLNHDLSEITIDDQYTKPDKRQLALLLSGNSNNIKSILFKIDLESISDLDINPLRNLESITVSRKINFKMLNSLLQASPHLDSLILLETQNIDGRHLIDPSMHIIKNLYINQSLLLNSEYCNFLFSKIKVAFALRLFNLYDDFDNKICPFIRKSFSSLPYLSLNGYKENKIYLTTLDSILNEFISLKALGLFDLTLADDNNISNSSFDTLEYLILVDIRTTASLLLKLLQKFKKLKYIRIHTAIITDSQSQELKNYFNKLSANEAVDFVYSPDPKSFMSARSITLNVASDNQYETSSDLTHKISVDANTAPRNQELHAQQIFYPLSKQEQYDPSNYRLQSYQHFECNPEVTSPEKAFSIFNDPDYRFRSANEIDFYDADLYSIGEPDNQYCYANVTLKLSSEWQALPSLSRNETIKHIHVKDPVAVEIQYSMRDQLYYIKMKEPSPTISVDIEYILLINQNNQTKNFPTELNPIIDYVKSFTNESLQLESNKLYTGTDYLNAIIKQKKGVCRHFALAFKALVENESLRASIPELSNLNLDGFTVHIIHNDIHAFVEIRYQEQWYTCDLGGAPGNVHIIDNLNTPHHSTNSTRAQTLLENDNPSASDPQNNVAHCQKMSIGLDENLDTALDQMRIKHLAELDLGDRDLTPEEIQGILKKVESLQSLTFGKCVLIKNTAQAGNTIQPNNSIAHQQQPINKNYFATPVKNDANALELLFKKLHEKNKQLILCNKEHLAILAYQLQAYFNDSNQAYYYIHSANELILRRSYIEKNPGDNNGKIKCGLQGELYQFLMASHTARTIIINYKNFTASELVKFNSIIDDIPNIDGVPLLAGTQVIAIMGNDQSADPSFYSRFKGNIEDYSVDTTHYQVPSPFVNSNSSTIFAEDEVLSVAFYGAANWQSKLLGSWGLNTNGWQFKPGVLLQRLKEPTPLKRIIFNHAPIHDEEFIEFFRQAQLKKVIAYNNEVFPWVDIEINCTHELNINSTPIIHITHHATQQYINEPKAILVNAHTLSRLFKQYTYVEDISQLIEQPGLLAEHEACTILSLFITDELTLNQWAQILAECAKLQVKLHLYLAPNISLPFSVPEHCLKKDDANSLTAVSGITSTIPQNESALHLWNDNTIQQINNLKQDCYITSNDIDLTLTQCWVPNCIIIDVSELNSANLLLKIKCDLKEINLTFRQEQGALITALLENKTVILHGIFSQELCHRLQDFLYQRADNPSRTGRVILVLDPEMTHAFNLLKLAKYNHTVTDEDRARQLKKYSASLVHNNTNITLHPITRNLPYVKQQAELRYQYYGKNHHTPWSGLADDLPNPAILDTIELDAKKATEIAYIFNQSRLQQVNNALLNSPFVFLAGKTGVGKTTFVTQQWHNEIEGRKVYIGIDRIREWADDKSPGIKKALFIDEANLTRTHWSQFEGMIHNNPPGIMIDNQFVELTKDHCCIFAGNPASYSYDRQVPRLFARHGNSIVFDPFPPAYIYQQMLLPLFDDLDLAQEMCEPILKVYQYLNTLSTAAVLLTARELIMMAQLSLQRYQHCSQQLTAKHIAQYYAFTLADQFVPEASRAKFKTHFGCERPQGINDIPTDSSSLTINSSNSSSWLLINDFLTLRQNYRDHSAQISNMGLGGILLESEPGLGKSELVRACLEIHNFKKLNLDSEIPDDMGNYYYHFPAGMNTQRKEAIFIKAFHKGVVVVCDEMNTMVSCEHLLNHLLMGQGENNQAPQYPGFMLLATQNPPSHKGRVKTSAALMHRLHYRKIPHYTRDEMLAILLTMGVPERRRIAIVDQYLQNRHKNSQLCFRDVIACAENELQELLNSPEPKELSQEHLLKLVGDEQSTAETLEAIFLHRHCTVTVEISLLNNPHTPSHVIAQLAEKTIENDIVRLRIIAEHPQCSAATLKKLSSNKNYPDILAPIIATHRNSDAAVLSILLSHKPSEHVLLTIANHPKANNTNFGEILELNYDINILLKISAHSAANKITLENILQKNQGLEIINNILKHRSCDEGILEDIIKLNTISNRIIIAVIFHPAATPKIYNHIIKHTQDYMILRYLLVNNKYSADNLLQLFDKMDDDLRLRVIESSKPETLVKLGRCLDLLKNSQLFSTWIVRLSVAKIKLKPSDCHSDNLAWINAIKNCVISTQVLLEVFDKISIIKDIILLNDDILTQDQMSNLLNSASASDNAWLKNNKFLRSLVSDDLKIEAINKKINLFDACSIRKTVICQILKYSPSIITFKGLVDFFDGVDKHCKSIILNEDLNHATFSQTLESLCCKLFFLEKINQLAKLVNPEFTKKWLANLVFDLYCIKHVGGKLLKTSLDNLDSCFEKLISDNFFIQEEEEQLLSELFEYLIKSNPDRARLCFEVIKNGRILSYYLNKYGDTYGSKISINNNLSEQQLFELSETANPNIVNFLSCHINFTKNFIYSKLDSSTAINSTQLAAIMKILHLNARKNQEHQTIYSKELIIQVLYAVQGNYNGNHQDKLKSLIEYIKKHDDDNIEPILKRISEMTSIGGGLGFFGGLNRVLKLVCKHIEQNSPVPLLEVNSILTPKRKQT